MEAAKQAGAARLQRLQPGGCEKPAVQVVTAAVISEAAAVADDEDESLDAVVGALNELREWREGTAGKVRSLGLALAAAPGLAAAVSTQLAALPPALPRSGSPGGSGPGAQELPQGLQRTFDAVLDETARLLQLAEEQVTGTVNRAAFTAQQLTADSHSGTVSISSACPPFSFCPRPSDLLWSALAGRGFCHVCSIVATRHASLSW